MVSPQSSFNLKIDSPYSLSKDFLSGMLCSLQLDTAFIKIDLLHIFHGVECPACSGRDLKCAVALMASYFTMYMQFKGFPAEGQPESHHAFSPQ